MIMNKCVYFCVWMIIFQNVYADIRQDSDLNITEIINKYGYPVETHEIETEDGYLLDVYRIPYGQRSLSKKPNKYPVLLSHGLMGSAENFIIMGPRKSLAYMLADHGYDVWLFNARGTWHSRKHRTLNPDRDPKFWQFTWHEIGVYDLPATIDYILKMTNTNKIHYVGHSQGTTSFFAMGSERPEYNKKIRVVIAMAPSAILRNIKEPFSKMFAPLYPFLQNLAHDLKIYELLPFISNKNVRALGKFVCNTRSAISSICRVTTQLLSGGHDYEMDQNVIPLLMSTAPAGGSVNQALHYAQIVAAGRFKQYDWGRRENLRRYHSDTPPEYSFKNITAPIALFYGEADELVTKEDVQILSKLLPNVIEVYRVPSETWTHMDFLWAKHIDTLLNNKVIEVMKAYNNK